MWFVEATSEDLANQALFWASSSFNLLLLGVLSCFYWSLRSQSAMAVRQPSMSLLSIWSFIGAGTINHVVRFFPRFTSETGFILMRCSQGLFFNTSVIAFALRLWCLFRIWHKQNQALNSNPRNVTRVVSQTLATRLQEYQKMTQMALSRQAKVALAVYACAYPIARAAWPPSDIRKDDPWALVLVLPVMCSTIPVVYHIKVSKDLFCVYSELKYIAYTVLASAVANSVIVIFPGFSTSPLSTLVSFVSVSALILVNQGYPLLIAHRFASTVTPGLSWNTAFTPSNNASSSLACNSHVRPTLPLTTQDGKESAVKHVKQQNWIHSTSIPTQTSRTFSSYYANLKVMALFKEHLKSEFSLENLSFLDDVNEFEGLNDHHQLTEKARHIYELYISKTGELQVNLNSMVTTALESKSVLELQALPTESLRTLFQEAKREITNLIERDSWQRFLSTENGKCL
jgi:hypothetical protein